MKVSVFVGGAAALLLASIPTGQCAPLDILKRGDFSANSGHWFQLQQLMHNIHSRIGIPFSAMRNVGLEYHQTLEVDPLDLVLLPNGYCYSCSAGPHNEPDESKRLNPFRNQMVELDEKQLIVACADDDSRSAEWRLMKACAGQERVLKDFLIDLTSDGSRLAVPKARLEHAPVFQLNKPTCMPKDPKQTSCTSPPPSISALPTSSSATSAPSTSTIATRSKLNVQDFAASIYSHKYLPTTTQPQAATSTSSRSSANKEGIATSASGFSTSTNPETISAPTSSIPSSTKHDEQPISTSVNTKTAAAPKSTITTSTKHDKLTVPTSSSQKSIQTQDSVTSATIVPMSAKHKEPTIPSSTITPSPKPEKLVAPAPNHQDRDQADLSDVDSWKWWPA